MVGGAVGEDDVVYSYTKDVTDLIALITTCKVHLVLFTNTFIEGQTDRYVRLLKFGIQLVHSHQ